MTRPLATAENRRLSELEESVEHVDPFEHEAARTQRRKWIAAGAAAVLLVGVAIALSVRARNHTAANAAPGSIDWKLSVFSNNRIEFRPSLAMFPRSTPPSAVGPWKLR